MWTKERIQIALRSRKAATAGVSLLSIAVGATAGYVVANRSLKAKYEQLAEQEIAEAKNFYAALNKPDPKDLVKKYETEEPTLVEEAVEALKTYQASEPEQIVEEEVVEVSEDTPTVVVNNIFVDNVPMNDDFNYEEELKHRSEEHPYILSHDEFYHGEKDYQQVTLTYFAGDDVLVDERDQPIEESDMTVGDENLKQFGHGSRDNNIVYIRNDRLEIDFEVVRNQGEYVREVLGFIEHSHRPGSGKGRRFRSDEG